jgi:hypothetical protein
MNTLKQFKRDIRNAKAVYAGVCVTTEDVNYIQVVKSDLLLQVQSWPLNTIINYTVDQDGYIHIN